MPPKFDPNIAELKAYKDFSDTGNSLTYLWNKLWQDFFKTEYGIEQIDLTIKKLTPEALPSVKNELIRVLTASGVKKVSKVITGMKTFSVTEIIKRMELSKKAFKIVAEDSYEGNYFSNTLEKLKKQGKISAEQYATLHTTRDRTYFYFNLPAKKLSEDEILKKANYLTGKDLDRNNLTDEEYNKILRQRKADAFNETLKTISEFDPSDYINLSDEMLVKKWSDINKYFLVYSAIENEIKGKDKELLDQTLLKKVFERAKNGRSSTAQDTFKRRLDVIANPYYAKTDIDFISKLSVKDRNTINNALSSKHNTNVQMTRFITSACAYYEGAMLHSVEYAKSHFDATNALGPDDVIFYDKSGKTLDPYDAQDYTGVFFAAPKDRPQQLTAFEVDYANNGTKILDPKPYAKVMKKIQKGFTNDLDKQEADELESLYKKLPTLNTAAHSLIAMAVGIYSNLIRNSNPSIQEQNKKTTLETLKKIYAPRRPKVSKDEYEKMFNITTSERLSMQEVEERRLLSEKAIDAIINAEIQSLECHTIPDNVLNTFNESRQVRAVIFKNGQEHKEENNKAFRDFFGLNEKYEKDLNISDEVINENRIRIIQDQLNYYKAIRDDLRKVNWTDEALINNYGKLQKLCLAMDMEWKRVIEVYPIKLGDDYKKLVEELREDIAYFNGFILPKADSIANPYYQFGYSDKMYLPKYESALSNHKDKKISSTYLTQMSGLVNKYIYYSKQLEPIIGTLENVEYAYTKNGDPLDLKDEISVTRMLEAGEEIFFFNNGKHEPTVISKSKDDFTKLETLPLTKEREEKARVMRANVAIDSVMAGINKALNPKRYVERMSAYVYMQFSIAQTYAQLEDLEGAAKTNKMSELREQLAEYLAQASIKVQLFKMHDKGLLQKGINEDIADEMLKPENLKKYAQQFIKSEAVDMLLKDMMDDPNSKVLFEKLDEEKLLKKFSENLVKEQKAKKEKALEESKKFPERAKSTIAYSLQSKIHYEPEFWGTNHDELGKIKSNSKFGGMTINRHAAQALALGYLVKEGYSLEKIFSNEQGMQEVRNQATKKVFEALTDENALNVEIINGRNTISKSAKLINDCLLAGANAIDKYIKDNIDKVKDCSAREFLQPQNSVLISASLFLTDFYQEIQSFYNNKPDVLQTEELDDVRDRVELNNGLLASFSRNTSYFVNNLAQNNELETTVTSCLPGVIGEAFAQAIIRYEMSLPENKGKDPALFGSTKTWDATRLETTMLQGSNEYKQFAKEISDSPTFAKKVIMAVLDGTLIESLNIKIKSITVDKDDIPVTDYTMNLDNMIATIKSKDVSQLKEFSSFIKVKPAQNEKQQEIKHTKAIDPNKKLKNIANQLNKLEKNEELKRSNSQPNIKAKGMSM